VVLEYLKQSGWNRDKNYRPFLSQSAGRDFCFFAGMVIGFYNAPIKKGISVTCGNNNTIEKEKKRREA
jgi:hypothetical protein